ncbi:hypothetical protein [Hymenobacter terrenus]|uniref:hypothetical protein n=1 Tax=Hymenobacter terrenus TaxID=1629124 RepID=UPI000619A090|nr:hypothetical protein [Hymenobacter terrenus]
MILKPKTLDVEEFTTSSFINNRQLLSVLDDTNEFKATLVKLFDINDSNANQVLKIGNAEKLLQDISELDSQCIKIDIDTKMCN